MLRAKVTLIFVLLTMFAVTSEVGREDISAEDMGASPINLTLTGHVGGRINKVVTDGNYAYFVTGPKVLIFNISEPTNPEKVGQTTVKPCLVENLTAVGDYLYTANGECGIFIFNISDPENPYDVSSFDTGQIALDIDVQGNYAYIADGFAPNDNSRGGLRIIDVSDKNSPYEIGAYGLADLQAERVVVSGNYAYVSNTNGGGVSIMDISNPSTPTILGFYDSPSYAFGLDISDNLLYIADRDNGLRIVDVSNPSSPSEVGALGTIGNAWDIAVSNNHAYVANLDGLAVINVSDPENPFEAGNYIEQTTRVEGLSVMGNYTYLADAYRGLTAVNVTNPVNPMLAGGVGLLGYTGDVAFSSNFAYVAGFARGLVAIDISNPTLPVESGFYTPQDISYPVVDVKTPYAYIADNHCCPSEENLEIVNITDPSIMSLIGDPIPWTIFGNPAELVVVGNYLYVAKGIVGLLIYDISDASNPLLISTFMDNVSEGDFQDVNIVGKYAYLPDADGGFFRIVDVSDPLNPTEVGNLDIPDENFNDIAVSGTLAYLVNAGSSSGKLLIVDISDPKNPVLLNTYSFLSGSRASDIQVVGNLIIASFGHQGVSVIDVADPAEPVEIGGYTKFSAAGISNQSSIQIHNDKIFLVDEYGGIYIFDWGACSISEDIDTDKDGLPDKWEICGYTDPNGGFVDLPAMGANPNIKDIFVEIDYMVEYGTNGTIGHSHQPNPAAIERVVHAFALQGIHLHIDWGSLAELTWGDAIIWGSLSEGEKLPHQDTLNNENEPWDNWLNWAGFDRIKLEQGHFRPERVPIFHYAILAHNLGGTLKGKPTIDTLGLSRNDTSSWDAFRLGGISDFVIAHGENKGTEYQQAGVFMHELGHNFGLHHGGINDDTNYEPNYLSVMNYYFAETGLIISGLGGNMDYSKFDETEIPLLWEEQLDETIGLNGISDVDDYGTYWSCGNPKDPERTENVNEPINWDCYLFAGGTDVQADINGNGYVTDTLTTSDDWSNLIFDAGTIGNASLPSASKPMTTQLAPGGPDIMDERFPSIPQPYSISLQHNLDLIVLPGSNLSIPITLTNRGYLTATVDITNTSETNWFDFSSIPLSLTLVPSETVEIEVALNVPVSSLTGENESGFMKASLVEAPLMSDSIVLSAQVGPKAWFEAEVTTGSSPLSVLFTDLSIGEIMSWQWDFGDGFTSTSQNPTHVYALPGNYTVSLTVTSLTGKDTYAREDLINITETKIYLPTILKQIQ